MSPHREGPASVPAKCFILGEYAVLTGLPAWLAAFSPRFSRRAKSAGGSAIHPQSPAGRWLQKSNSAFEGLFFDPFNSAGGFGASTAQFLLAHDPAPTPQVWADYRGLFLESELRPSGADLVCQQSGGLVFFQIHREGPFKTATESFESRTVAIPGTRWPIAVFSATQIGGRKVDTHAHLSQRDLSLKLDSPALWSAWSPILLEAGDALSPARALDVEHLGSLMTRYARALGLHGLESPAAREDRLAIEPGHGVWGVKGCGALLNDSLIVAYDPKIWNSSHLFEAEWYQTAMARGLECVTPELTLDIGLSDDR